jgi:DNA-binding PadR family transcriptional regulator
LTQGTIYPALLRLEQRGLISAEWGVSDQNRKTRFHSITRAGRKQLRAEVENWQRMMGIINRVLEGAQGGDNAGIDSGVLVARSASQPSNESGGRA